MDPILRERPGQKQEELPITIFKLLTDACMSMVAKKSSHNLQCKKYESKWRVVRWQPSFQSCTRRVPTSASCTKLLGPLIQSKPSEPLSCIFLSCSHLVTCNVMLCHVMSCYVMLSPSFCCCFAMEASTLLPSSRPRFLPLNCGNPIEVLQAVWWTLPCWTTNCPNNHRMIHWFTKFT